ncbi:MAG: acyl-CoA thioesterase [Gammaproteobacteria bacterium]|jgi:acyl-CoA thioester hydrolase|nr:acyl-CoA thioesterase [Gammaproteobacteria bacterium]
MAVIVHYEIPFHDIDSLGIVWHGHYYKYFELARTALYRSLSLDVDDIDSVGLVFPVIESRCRYRESLRYGQKVEIGARFREWEYYILIEYEIHEIESGKRAAYGFTKQVVCDRNGKLQQHVPENIVGTISGHVSKAMGNTA